MNRSVRAVAAAMLVVLTAPGARAQAQSDDKLIDQIAADWAKRQARVERVRYRVSGDVQIVGDEIEAGGFTAKFDRGPPPRLPFNWTLLLDFKGQRHHFEQEDTHLFIPDKSLRRHKCITAFDGKQWSRRYLIEDKPTIRSPSSDTRVDIVIGTGKFSEQHFEVSLFTAFYGHGVVPFSGTDRVHPGLVAFAPNLEALTVHGRASLNGRACVVLRTPASQGTDTFFHELWVDLARESAVVRHSRFAGKTPQMDLVLWHRETPAGWLPDRWEQTMRTSSRSAEVKRGKMEVIDLDPAVTSSDFRIAETPGMLVEVGHYPTDTDVLPALEDAKTYQIDADGRRREVVIENAVISYAPGGVGRTWKVAGLIAAVVASAAAAAILWRRRARPPRSDGDAGRA